MTVRVLENYWRGQPIWRHFCLHCADQARSRAPAGLVAESHLNVASWLLAAGFVLAALAISADQLGLQGHYGFGWRQRVGVALGVVGLAAATLVRSNVLALANLSVIALAALVDVLHIGGSAGPGWKQQALALLATAMLGWGVWLKRRARAVLAHEEEPRVRREAA